MVLKVRDCCIPLPSSNVPRADDPEEEVPVVFVHSYVPYLLAETLRGIPFQRHLSVSRFTFQLERPA